MNLPLILDIVLGLIFIYLILSLLASEIQELLAALLQWRAKHLRESITNLLQGGEQPPLNEQYQVQELVKKIYDDPLIRNINQTAIEGIASIFRSITWLLPNFYNWVIHFVKKDRERTFGDQRSAPSYIPAETFATTLIESIGISDLSRLLMQQRLKRFTKERLSATIKSTLNDVFNKSQDAKDRVSRFDEELQQIVEDYKNSEATLQTSVFRMMESFDMLLAFFGEHNQSITPQTRSELKAIKKNYFGETGERAFLFGLSPSPSELMELIDKGSRVYKEIEPAFIAAFEGSSQALARQVDQKIVELKLEEELAKVEAKPTKIIKKDRAQFASAAMESLNLSESDRKTYHKGSSPAIARQVDRKIVELKLGHKKTSKEPTEEDRTRFASAAMESLNLSESDRKTYEVYITYQKIDRVIDRLPKYVRDSLKILARRAESRIQQVGTQVQQVGNEVEQLRIEIEAWFDRSMDRASGVYKRNVKGIAIVLGFVLAAATNSDTFHIFSRLSDDEKLRQVIVQNATTISQNSNPQQPTTFDEIRRRTDNALKEIPLPIGWNPIIVKHQLNCNNEKVNNWSSMNKNCNSVRNPFRDKSKPVTSVFIPGVIIGAMLSSFGNGAIMLAGWLVSGIAIAMGAPFWFDLLSKVVNVRNTGKPPNSSTTNQTTSSSQPNAPGS